MTTLYVFSAGGHFQLFNSVINNRKDDDIYVTFHSHALEEENFLFVRDASQSLPAFLICFLQSLKIFFLSRPKKIVSFGAGVAVPLIILGWLARVPVVHIDLPCQISRPSKTAKLSKFLGVKVIFTSAIISTGVQLDNVNYFDYISHVENEH